MIDARKNKTNYFIKERGWLDLLGSIPSLRLTNYGALLRLARLSRLARITRLLRGQNKKELIEDVVQNRNHYTAFITILMTMIVLTIASVLVLQFESKNPDANIQTGWDSFWYSVVTITTVGYGDRYPITIAGRITAMFIMFMGVGIIGALASILSSILVGSPATSAEEEKPSGIPSLSTFMLMALMFIGTGPASTGGGITTGTFLVLWLAMISYARGLD